MIAEYAANGHDYGHQRMLPTLRKGRGIGHDTSMRILIADDDRVTRRLLVRLLESQGHEVVGQAVSGDELVQLAAQLKPDLVITDVVMPGTSGFEAAEEIYSKQRLPVILLTAYTDPKLVEEGLEHNAIAYLTKPIDSDQLMATMMVAIKQHKQIQELQSEARDLHAQLTARKIIERAKGILMRRSNLAEDAAYRKMQKIARSRGRKMVEIAEDIISASDIL